MPARCTLVLIAAFAATGCSGSTKSAPSPRVDAPTPPPPSGPTRTDFKKIAKKLLPQCVGGGWINRWRAEHEDVNVARPKVVLEPFEDRTEQDLDPVYLNSILAQRMRISGVFDVVDEPDGADFIARGQLLRLAERKAGRRVSVYTALLNFYHPKDRRTVHTCQATVEGEL